MSKDIPIIFSASMVRALLDGRKTMTRRIISLRNCEFGSIRAGKLSKLYWQHAAWDLAWPDRGFPDEAGNYRSGYLHAPCHDDDNIGAACEVCQDYGWDTTSHRLRPKVQVGDRLWVRENLTCSGAYIQYAADAKIIEWEIDRAGIKGRTWPVTWLQDPRPSIHMPRAASRLTEIVTAIKIERLQDISEEDAIAEGVNAISMVDVRRQAAWSARGDFAQLWNVLHGSDAWDKNPFVIATTFRTVKANIDSAEVRAAA